MVTDIEAELAAVYEETLFWHRLCATLSAVHHLPDKGTPEREALIEEIKADPVGHCRRIMDELGTEEIDALLASLGRTRGLNEEDPYGDLAT